MFSENSDAVDNNNDNDGDIEDGGAVKG